VALTVPLAPQGKRAGVRRIAIYMDTGVWAAEAKHALPALLDWLGHERTYLTAKQIEAGALRKHGARAFDLLVVPGGWAGDYIQKVGGWDAKRTGDDEIRKFVAAGGGYLGFCAGAFAAARTTRWAGHDYAYTWKLFDGRAEGPLAWNQLRKGGALRAGHGTAELDRTLPELRGRGLPAIVRPMLYGGPRFVPRRGKRRPPGWRVLARHGEDKTPAIITFRYGGRRGGHVVLSSFHPAVLTGDHGRLDRDTDTFAWALAGEDPDGSAPDWRLAAALVDIALGMPTRKAPALPSPSKPTPTTKRGRPRRGPAQGGGRIPRLHEPAAGRR